MKKYLVWKSGSAPTAGVVIKAESSFEARSSVAHRRNIDSVSNGLGKYYTATDFCARLVPDADEVVSRAIKHISEVVHVAPPPVTIKRCWINQPALGQKLHEHHGKNVLVAFNHEGYETVVYFTEGPIVSIAGEYAACLSDGWRDERTSYLTPVAADKLRKLVLAHVKAETERSWVGSQPVEDRAAIHAEANDANTAYKRFVVQLEGK